MTDWVKETELAYAACLEDIVDELMKSNNLSEADKGFIDKLISFKDQGLEAFVDRYERYKPSTCGHFTASHLSFKDFLEEILTARKL